MHRRCQGTRGEEVLDQGKPPTGVLTVDHEAVTHPAGITDDKARTIEQDPSTIVLSTWNGHCVPPETRGWTPPRPYAESWLTG